jgi:hypothetical protein
MFPIDRLNYVEYSRVKDDMSDAKVQIPTSADCCGDLANVEPIRHELVIFRDGQRVWEGPITRIAYSNNEVELNARDVIFWPYRTIMREAYNNAYPHTGYGTERIGTILRAELARREAGANPINVLPYLQVHTTADTARTSRSTLPYQKTVFEEIDDMASKGGVDFTAIGRAIHVQDTGYALGVTPLATEADFLTGVIVTVYGMDLSTYTAVTDGEGRYGIASVTDPYYGEIETLVTTFDETEGAADPNNSDDDGPTQAEMNSQASSNLAQRYPMPVVVRVPENSQIDPASQAFSFEYLVPGVKVPLMATAGCRQVRQDQKIERVDVKQDAKGEVVTVSLVPFPVHQAIGPIQ